jgi:hypothetical protein
MTGKRHFKEGSRVARSRLVRRTRLGSAPICEGRVARSGLGCRTRLGSVSICKGRAA